MSLNHVRGSSSEHMWRNSAKWFRVPRHTLGWVQAEGFRRNVADFDQVWPTSTTSIESELMWSILGHLSTNSEPISNLGPMSTVCVCVPRPARSWPGLASVRPNLAELGRLLVEVGPGMAFARSIQPNSTLHLVASANIVYQSRSKSHTTWVEPRGRSSLGRC